MNITDSYLMYAFITTVFLALFLMTMGIGKLAGSLSRRSEMKQKIQESRDTWEYDGEPEETPAASFFQRLFTLIGKIAPGFNDQSTAQYSALRLRLLRAGIRSQNAPSMFWGAKVFLLFLICIGFFILKFTVLKPMTGQVFMGLTVGLGVIGFYTPDLWLYIRAQVRRQKIIKAMPDALDLMVVCVEAGLGLDSAIKRISKEMRLTHPELSSEFDLLNLELRAGKSRQDALRALSLRTNISSLNSLVTLIIQTDKFGTSIAKALRVFSESYRNERFQKAEEAAAKLPVKMLFPLIFFIFPSFLLIMVGPGVIRIYETFIKMGQ
ncbi:MAG: type II secretion system F family protein [Desulfobacterales bacterium]|jgi:tight adherence protein C|nr:type II secretion system F family protein [Desulfobacterales bacterium]